jgi:hypothetical protein
MSVNNLKASFYFSSNGNPNLFVSKLHGRHYDDSDFQILKIFNIFYKMNIIFIGCQSVVRVPTNTETTLSPR